MDLKDIKFKCKQIQLSSTDRKDTWKKMAHKYSVTITYRGKSMSTQFYTGSGWTREPDMLDVLGSLLLDASYTDYSFEEFCAEAGYDTDSRRAYSMYRSCKRTAKRLNVLFTESELSEIYNTLDNLGRL